jgi:hypothetical protein
VGLAAATQLLAVARHDEQAVVDGQAQPHGGGEVEGVDRDQGELREHPQHEEGAEDGEHADAHGEPGGHHAAEHQHQQHQGDGDGDALGPGQVGLDGGPHLAVDLGDAAHPHRHHVGVAGQRGRQLLDVGGHRVLVAADAGQHQSLTAVLAPQRRW